MRERNEMPRTCRRFLWLVLVFASVLGSCVIFYHATYTPTYTIDSYFYLSKARQLADGQGLRTAWNDGMDTKYFPGYSVFLAFPSLFGSSYVPLQIILYLLCGSFLLALARELELEPVEGLLATTAFVANPIAIKWLSLPMAEGAALALSLLSANLFLRSARMRSYSLLFAACMVGGVAAVTRVESLFLLVVFGAIIFPRRKTVAWPRLLAGALLFVLPLLTYWISLRSSAAGGSAYLEELQQTFLKFDLLKNFAYNVWVPFGFMHRPVESFQTMQLMSAAVLTGAVWFVLGEIVFLAGLACSFFGRLGPRVRSAGLLFVAYALLHSFWYYRYERFMLMALPLAAMVWAATARAAFQFLKGKKEGGWWILILAQLLVAATGIYWGNEYSSRHSAALQQDTSWLRFQDIAAAVNGVNREPGSAVLTDLGPHLAYYVDAHTYLDTEHGNYWQRAFPAERTLEEMDRLGIGFVVTGKESGQWLDEHEIPATAKHKFRDMEDVVEGASIIKYMP